MYRGQSGVRRLTSIIAFALLIAGQAKAQVVKFAVQPILAERATERAFTPLAQYIGKVLGSPCRLVVNPNFLAYWQMMRKPHEYAFMLDAAHFTDYRLTHLGYHLLVKEPGTVSYSLVARSSEMVFGPSDLIGQRVATLGIPSMGAALLSRMFPHPTRQPLIVGVANAAAGLRLLKEHKVAAAMIPTPLIGEQMAQGAAFTVVATSPPVPNVAISAAPWVPAAERARVRFALLHAPSTLFHEIGLPRFVPAHPAQYKGQDRLLKRYWGY